MDQAMTKSAGNDLGTLFTAGAVGGLSDAQLLERFTKGAPRDSQAAFEAVVRRYGPIVLGVCRRVLDDPSGAEDVFQATFLVLARKSGSIVRRESLGPWLHSVAFRIAHRARAFARKRREEPLLDRELVGTESNDPVAAELREILDAELHRLPDKYRRPVVLCFLEGRTQEEAASVLGWTKGTVSRRLARAKDLLKTRLVRRGLAPSVGLLAQALTPEATSAAVPTSLANNTARAAWALLLGHAEAATVSGTVSMLTRVGMRMLFVSQLKAAIAAVAAVTAIACSALVVAPSGSGKAIPAPVVAGSLGVTPLLEAPAPGKDDPIELAPIPPEPPVEKTKSPPLDPKSPFGTIRGRLVWGGDDVPAPEVWVEQSRAPKDRAFCANNGPIFNERLVIDRRTRGVRYAFAYLVKPVGTNDEVYQELIRKKPAAVLDQQECVFVPHSLAMHQDQPLELRSADPISHSVNIRTFTNPKVNEVVRSGRPVRKTLVAERRPLSITCDIHVWMKANLMVFDHPFFAVTAADGSFEIRGVPAADQYLVIWQEATGYVTGGSARGMPIMITAGKVADVGEIKIMPEKVR